MGSLFSVKEPDGVPSELTSFLTRCFIARVRCLLDSTSGFLVCVCVSLCVSLCVCVSVCVCVCVFIHVFNITN